MQRLILIVVPALLLLANSSQSTAQTAPGYWSWNEQLQTNVWVESRPALPTNQVWIPGQWNQNGNTKIWVPGHFQQVDPKQVDPKQVEPRKEIATDKSAMKKPAAFTSYNARFKQELDRRRARDAAQARQRAAGLDVADGDSSEQEQATLDAQQLRRYGRNLEFLVRQRQDLQDFRLQQALREIQLADQALAFQLRQQESARARRQSEQANRARLFEQQRQRDIQEAQRIRRFNDFQRSQRRQEASRDR